MPSVPLPAHTGPKGDFDVGSTGYQLLLARRQLSAGLDLKAKAIRQTLENIRFKSFTGQFSDDLSALAGDNTPAAKAGPNDYDRQIESIKNQISELNLEAEGAGKTSQAVQELKTAHDLNDAAMKANIPVTAQMREQWKNYADTIADLNLKIKEQKALQDEQFKGATDVHVAGGCCRGRRGAPDRSEQLAGPPRRCGTQQAAAQRRAQASSQLPRASPTVLRRAC